MKSLITVLAVVSLLALVYPIPQESVKCEGCNVVVFTAEPLRADHMTVYGYEENTTPHLNDFAEKSYVFERGFAQSHHTLVSLYSTFTSLYPSQHSVGVENADERGYSDEFRVIAESFQDSGYHTEAIVSGGNTDPGLGFERGFDNYTKGKNPKGSIRRVSRSSGEKPFFFFYQTFTTHEPYWSSSYSSRTNVSRDYERVVAKHLARSKQLNEEDLSTEEYNTRVIQMRNNYFSQLEENESLRREAINHYDASIRNADRDFEQLISELRKEGELDNTVVIFMSQHGEEFGEHGRWSHESLFNEVMRVPLIIRVPGSEGGRIERPVENIDVGPTLIDILGIKDNRFTRKSNGVSLRPLMEDGKIKKDYVMAESAFEKAFIDVSTGLKYVSSSRAEYEKVFNISRDFEEEKEIQDEDLRDYLIQKHREFRRENVLNSTENAGVYPYYAR